MGCTLRGTGGCERKLRKAAENYDELARRAERICTVQTLNERRGQEARQPAPRVQDTDD
jgi:hypothetical protein